MYIEKFDVDQFSKAKKLMELKSLTGSQKTFISDVRAPSIGETKNLFNVVKSVQTNI